MENLEMGDAQRLFDAEDVANFSLNRAEVTEMDISTPVHNQTPAAVPRHPFSSGPIPLTLSFEEGDQDFLVPDPEELPKDLGLSPSHKYLLRFLREHVRPPPTGNAESSVSELVTASNMNPHVDQVLDLTSNTHEDVMSSSLSNSRSASHDQTSDRNTLPAGFSPNGVKGLLTKISRAVEIGPTKKKLRYQFHSRVSKPEKSPPMRRKLRLQRALRGENPFLQWRTELHCCDRYRCFATLCPHYLFEEYKKVNAMNKVHAKRYLISLFDTNDKLWYVRGNTVCSRFLQKAFGFSSDLQCQIKGTPGARSAPKPRALPREVLRKTKRWHISNFILKLAGRFAEAMPHKAEFTLPVFTKTMLWVEFNKYWKESLQTRTDPTPSKCYFFRIWKIYAFMVKVHKKNRGFTLCSRCEMLRKEMSAHLRDEETLHVLIEQYAYCDLWKESVTHMKRDSL